jgi:hypothetical protein
MTDPQARSYEDVPGCPSAEELLAVLRDADEFTIAIRGFSCVERAVDVLLEDALPAVQAVDVERLTINLKLNLTVALKLLPSEDTRAILALSKIRNTFAHDFRATLSADQARNLVNVLSERQRHFYDAIRETENYDKHTLWKITMVLWTVVTRSVAEHRSARDTNAVYEELLAEDLRRLNAGERLIVGEARDEEVNRRVARRQEERKAMYESRRKDA